MTGAKRKLLVGDELSKFASWVFGANSQDFARSVCKLCNLCCNLGAGVAEEKAVSFQGGMQPIHLYLSIISI